MRLSISLIAVVCLGLSSGRVRAEAETGSYFLQACSAAERVVLDGEAPRSEQDIAQASFCIGYVSGFMDGPSSKGGVKMPVCMPANLNSKEQAVRRFVKFLREAKPEVLRQPGGDLLGFVLLSSFSCK
jgi:hypothetical protein